MYDNIPPENVVLNIALHMKHSPSLKEFYVNKIKDYCITPVNKIQLLQSIHKLRYKQDLHAELFLISDMISMLSPRLNYIN